MTWAGSNANYFPLNPQIFPPTPCLQGIVSLSLLPHFYPYLPPWHRSHSWNLNDPWRQLDFIKDLMESWHVSSSSCLVFHLVVWEGSPQLPGSHIWGKWTDVELWPEESHFLSSSPPQKSLQSMGVCKDSHVAKSSANQAAFSLSKQELWERCNNGLKPQSFPVSQGCTFLGLWGSPLVVKGLRGLFWPAPHKSMKLRAFPGAWVIIERGDRIWDGTFNLMNRCKW